MTQNEISQLIKLITSECNSTKEQAEEYLNSAIEHLQELKLEGDLRIRDIKGECEGLLGVTHNSLFLEYASIMTQEENIPESLKEKHMHNENEEFEDNSEFNPYDYLGCLGEEICQEVYEMMY